MRKNIVNSPRFFVVLVTYFFLTNFVFATDYTSTNFDVADPVINPASYGTSSNFRLYGTLSEPSIGESAASDFSLKAGFLYFPFVTSPVPSATAGNGEVALSWTSASGFLGWTVSGYSVGQATSPGGPYTYSTLGNVLSSTRGGLSNGATYYFVIRVQDYFGNFIATSSEVSATPSGVASNSGGGGGGGPYVENIPSLLKGIKECQKIADLNCDGYVDLFDFSIMYYWFEKENPPIRVDLFVDGKIDIRDFSVMAYYWDERPDLE